MNKNEIQYEIDQITAKLQWIAAYDLWERYDSAYLENKLRELRAELEEVDI